MHRIEKIWVMSVYLSHPLHVWILWEKSLQQLQSTAESALRTPQNVIKQWFTVSISSMWSHSYRTYQSQQCITFSITCVKMCGSCQTSWHKLQNIGKTQCLNNMSALIIFICLVKMLDGCCMDVIVTHCLFELNLIVRGSCAPKTPPPLNNSLFIYVLLCQKWSYWHSCSLNIIFTDKSTLIHPIASPKHSNKLV